MTIAIDPADWRRAVGAKGLLRTFNEADVLESADVHVAQRLTALAGESDESVALAIAMAVRAVRGGSVCVDLHTVAEHTGAPDLPWPSAQQWITAVKASPLTGRRAVVRISDDGIVYLDRYWREEEQVADDLTTLLGTGVGYPVPDATRLFPPGFEEQRSAAEIALRQQLTVLTGGPGTGKTTTVARLLVLLGEQLRAAGRPRMRVALAAPTGKAAARLTEAVQGELQHLDAADRRGLEDLSATTLHRLLGSRPENSSRFRHDRSNRLPHDVIVVDETSMVSLTMMARLLEAVRPETRLVLVGDPDQLMSVEAGAVLADLVEGISARGDSQVAALATSHRYGRSIGELAEAIRAGSADRAIEILRSGTESVHWLDSSDPAPLLREMLVAGAVRLREYAMAGDTTSALAALDEHRLLCAHRRGAYGVEYWNRLVERWLTETTGEIVRHPWYVGRPLLVKANDYGLGVYNGDTGITMSTQTDTEPAMRAVIASATGNLDITPGRLADVETMHAMTIHKSQGSQADEVTVLLPGPDSRLLTRELLYTAVTRAKSIVRVAGTEESVRRAIERRAVRATGLRERLQPR